MGYGIQQSPGVSNTVVETTLEAIAGFFTQPYDEMVITYVVGGAADGSTDTITTKKNSIAVQILTFTYDGDGNLINLVVT